MSDTKFPFISALEKTIQKYIEDNDLVEVVRCKDCKYLNIINKAHVYAFCGKHNRIFYLWEEDTRKHFCSWGENREDAGNNLIDTPTAETKPVRHGHWEWDGYVYDMPWQCSECSCYNEYDDDYCPNCGAKMDGEKR